MRRCSEAPALAPDYLLTVAYCLVTDNVYRYIRHPMYASLFLLATGVALKQPTYWPAIVVFAIVVVAVYLTAKAEEQDTLATFGAAYAAYMKTSKMFIPFVL